MKRLILFVALLAGVTVAPFVWRAKAQVGIGGAPAPAFATSVAGCPTLTIGYYLCVVVPPGAQPFLALSVAGYNGGAPFAVQGALPALTASATTLPPGSQATVSLQGAAFAFGIPAGADGATGAQGPAGPVQSFGTTSCPTWSNGSGAITLGPGCRQSTP